MKLRRMLSVVVISTAIVAHANDASDQAQLVDNVQQLLRQAENSRLQGNYTDGIARAKKAQLLASELANPQLEVESIYQLSLLYYHQQDYAQARAEMKMGLARARVHELERLEADFLAAEGVLEWKQGNLHLALPKLQEAMSIRESNGDSVSMASISNNIGIIYYTLRDYEDAEFYYRKGLEFLASEENVRLRNSLYSNLAEVLIPMDRLEEAEGYLARALEIDESLQEPASLAYTYFNLGELESRRGRPDKAIGYYRKALKLQTGIDDKWALALTRLRMAKEYLDNGDAQESLDQMLSGYELVQQLNALSLLRDYSEQFIKLYEHLNEPGRVQFYRDQYEWLAQRVRLEEKPIEPKVVQPETAETAIITKTELSLVETVIIVLLGLLILILILENSRLRGKASGSR